jgi:hypothetical protein
LDRIATGGMGSVEMLACFREPRAANWTAIAAPRSERLRGLRKLISKPKTGPAPKKRSQPAAVLNRNGIAAFG